MLALPELSHCYCFADDTKICSSVDPEKLQSDLSTISLWAYDNQMTFHKDKCCYLHFQKTKAYHLVLGHQTLQEKSTAVDLGVTISNDLSWNAHILTKLVNATKSLNFLRHSVPPSSSFESKTQPLPIVCCFHHFILFFFLVGKYWSYTQNGIFEPQRSEVVLWQFFLQQSSPCISNNAHRLSENRTRLALVCRHLLWSHMHKFP